MAAPTDNIVIDSTGPIIGGMDSGQLPRLLPLSKASFAFNTTFRGGFSKDRPKFRRINLDYGGDVVLQALLENNLFQDACYYQPDAGDQSLVASIGGRLFYVTPDADGNATVTDISIPGDPNPPDIPKAWLWQAEKWVIVQDGQSVPIFFDGAVSRRAIIAQVLGTIAAPGFTTPSPGGIAAAVPLTGTFLGQFNQKVTVSNGGVIIGDFQTAPSGSGGFNAVLTKHYDTLATEPSGGQVQIRPSVGGMLAAPLQVVASTTARGTAFVQLASPYLGPLAILAHQGTVFKGQSVSIGGLTLFPYAVNGSTLQFGYNKQVSTVTIPAGTIFTYSGNTTPNVTVGILQQAFAVPATGASVNVILNTAYTGANGQVVYINNAEYAIAKFAGAQTTSIDLQNLTANSGIVVPAGATINSIAELPTGRMGAYGMGRNFLSLIDGISFTASDLVGDSSGTPAESFRDAVLNITTNPQLTGGKPFRVPGAGQTITGMTFPATMDVSLGQGPLQVFTDSNIFSCQVPVDSTTWALLKTPILTESLKGAGGAGQDSIALSNADIIFRSSDKQFRSLTLARLDYNKWGNTPISYEMVRAIALDDISLIPFASSSVFDNRYLTTCHPVSGQLGVYSQGIIAINFDAISSLNGKSPSIYDGLWTGLQVLKLVPAGKFNSVVRQFMFCYDTDTQAIQLWEMLPTDAAIVDNAITPVIWGVESADLFRGDKGELTRVFKALEDGELSVDDVQGTVNIQVFYKPDQYPGWVLWKAWQISTDMSATDAKPGYFPRMGLGRPDSADCNDLTEQSLRFGYTFQTRIVIQGHCRILGARYSASIQPQPKFAQPVCEDKHRGISVPAIDDFAIFNQNAGITQLPATP